MCTGKAILVYITLPKSSGILFCAWTQELFLCGHFVFWVKSMFYFASCQLENTMFKHCLLFRYFKWHQIKNIVLPVFNLLFLRHHLSTRQRNLTVNIFGKLIVGEFFLTNSVFVFFSYCCAVKWANHSLNVLFLSWKGICFILQRLQKTKEDHTTFSWSFYGW